ncbi:hypothetical protein PQR34_44005 [Paraburkholderia sediminicola]|uniref:hypothetical protein n=1 Tax=Paraburkholderia sediminicola TaxID=458836 RepID=UPI0038BC82BA
MDAGEQAFETIVGDVLAERIRWVPYPVGREDVGIDTLTDSERRAWERDRKRRQRAARQHL